MVKVLTPLERTREALDISATERDKFKTCRRRWELTTLENLEPVYHHHLNLIWCGNT